MIDGVVLGLIQGVFEWLPVSSEGVLVAFMSVVSELTLKMPFDLLCGCT